ncbi:hypothetical protein KUCAC02_024331, partial [Chaenocephalus aceratus]
CLSSSANPPGCGCGSARQQKQPQAPSSSCQQALETGRKRAALPPTSPGCSHCRDSKGDGHQHRD